MDLKKKSAYLLITCDLGKLDQVITQLKQLNCVKEIQGTHGAYDVIARVESTTREFLQEFIIRNIRTLVDIKSTITLHCKPNSNNFSRKNVN